MLGLRIAVSSLKAHKLRAVLAVLGVFLGAFALTGVRLVSKSMLRAAEIETEKLGPNLFMAAAGQIRLRRDAVSVGKGAKTFTTADARALRDGMPSALRAAPFVAKPMPVRTGRDRLTAQLVATTPDYVEVRSFKPEFGRFFDQADVDEMDKVCVLGRNVAVKLFGEPEKALDQTILFFRAPCKVIGVMEEKGADITGTDQDEQLFTPITTYMRRFANQNWISGVYIRLAPGADGDQAKDTAVDILRKRRKAELGKKDDFSVVTAKDTAKLQKQVLDLVETLGLISSIVSFGVGGLGILSIMVLLVRSRRLEIGVRRATGAKRRDIVRQFLFEAGLMSTAGGACGVLGGVLLISGLALGGVFPFVIDLWLIFGALAASMCLGLVAGAYPAAQAAKLEILDVLRSHE